MDNAPPTESPTVKPAELYLLVALADQPLHGYALAHRMREESQGRVRLLPGNLYAILRRLEQGGLVAESKDAESSSAPAAGRRRRFELTPRGRRVLREESRQMARTVDLIDARLAEEDGATP